MIPLLLLLLSLRHWTEAEFNGCLTQVGCYADECCFPIVPRLGPICVQADNCPSASFPPECCLNKIVAATPYGHFYGYRLLLDDLFEFRTNGQKYLH
ncbi:Potassium voltage-gated channel subfamily B member 1, partial [Cichlidogyrus casuarinus]